MVAAAVPIQSIIQRSITRTIRIEYSGADTTADDDDDELSSVQRERESTVVVVVGQLRGSAADTASVLSCPTGISMLSAALCRITCRICLRPYASIQLGYIYSWCTIYTYIYKGWARRVTGEWRFLSLSRRNCPPKGSMIGRRRSIARLSLVVPIYT